MTQVNQTNGVSNLFPTSEEDITTEWFKGLMKNVFKDVLSVKSGTTVYEADGALGLLIPFEARISEKNSQSGEKLMQLLVKIKADLSEMYNDIKPLHFHPRESFAYGHMLPLFFDVARERLSAANQEKFLSIYAKSFFSAYDLESSKGLVVLENLKVEGFDVINFVQGLSMPELELSLRSLAYHHALSHLVMQEKKTEFDSTEFQNFLNWVPKTNLLSVWGTFLAEGLRWFSNLHPEKTYLESQLNQLAARSADILGQYADTTHGGLPVICHGDFWCNNLMFRKNNGDSSSVKLIDLQCVAFGTPGKDLATLLLSSITRDLRRSSTDKLVAYYHSCFQDASEMLGMQKDLLSLDNLKKDFYASLLNGVLWCFISFQMFIETDEAEDRLYWVLQDMSDKGVF